jgi:hypothetical protein
VVTVGAQRATFRKVSLVVLAAVVFSGFSSSGASAYSWQPLNAEVRATSINFRLGNGYNTIICRAAATGRTAASYSADLTLRLVVTPECQEEFVPGYNVPRTVRTLREVTIKLTAIRQSQTTGHGEGSVFASAGALELTNDFCSLAIGGEYAQYPNNEEFNLYEYQYSGNSLAISNRLNYEIRREFNEWYCRGAWYISMSSPSGSVLPYGLRIGLP